MLENYAIQYVNLPEAGMLFISWGLMVAGGLMTLLLPKRRFKLDRAPYFCLTTLIALGLVAGQAVWLQSMQAIAGGYLWVLMLANFAIVVAAGVLTALIAAARSRSVYGESKKAYMAFIPIANLELHFKASEDVVWEKRQRKETGNKTDPKKDVLGGVSVTAGLICLVFTFAVMHSIKDKINSLAAQKQEHIETLIQAQGVEGAVRLVAVLSGAQVPVVVDWSTTLEQIKADGPRLSRVYAFDGEIDTLSDDARANIVKSVCSEETFATLLQGGAVVREVYYRKNDGSQIGTVTVSKDACNA